MIKPVNKPNNIMLFDTDCDDAIYGADVGSLLNGEAPCIGYDTDGIMGPLIFPPTAEGMRLAQMLADQLNAAVARTTLLPYEDSPEPGCLPEPEGGEEARVMAEEVANAAHVAAAAQADEDLLWRNWRPGDRFILAPADDHPRQMACGHLWPGSVANTPGAVVARLRVMVTTPFVEHFLLVDFDGHKAPFAVHHGLLTACARKVTS